MVGQGVGIAVVPKAAAVRCAKSAGIKHIALTDAWASRELLLCLRSSDELPVYVRQMMTFIRSEERTSELQSLMRISYAVLCLKKKNKYNMNHDMTKLISPHTTTRDK